MSMIPNYFVVAWRNARRHTLFSIINILSLTTGFAACLIIYLFIQSENSFDSFHSKRKQIFRLIQHQEVSTGGFEKVALNGPPFGPSMVNEFPELETFVRVEPLGKQIFRREHKQILLDKETLRVDSTFLRVFDFEVLHGHRQTMLNGPSDIVLTKSTALKFFRSDREAIGNLIIMGDNKKLYTVTGIVEDAPAHSHMQFAALTSYVSEMRAHPEYSTDWTGNWLYTYFVLNVNADAKHVASKFPEWLIRWTAYKEVNEHYAFSLQALDQIHLNSSDVEHDYLNYARFNGTYLNIFAVIGLFIIVIASLNFVNLSNARSSYRWKEIGVRKSIGAKRSQLIFQFLLESVLLSIIALILAVVCDGILSPFLKDKIGVDISMMDLLRDTKQLAFILMLSVAIGICSALYPSLYLSSVSAIKSLKGIVRRNGKPVLQSTLVTIQFGVALALIVGTLVITKQLQFIQNEKLGFNKDQIMLVRLNKESREKLDVLKTELKKIAAVVGATATGQRLGNNIHQSGFFAKTSKGVMSGFNSRLSVDEDFLNVYEITLMMGRDFDATNKAEIEHSHLINESMVKALQLDDPIGTMAGYDSKDSLNGQIIGVVKDFNFNSLHHKVSPLSITRGSVDWFAELSIRIKADHVDQTIADVKAVWEKSISTYPFDYTFLDVHFTEIYQHDRQLGVVVIIMSALSLFIAGIGLFGLTAIITERRTKEVAIRRVHGASAFQIATLLSSNLLLLVILSFILITPATYLVLRAWLTSFAYRIDVDLLYFIIALMIVTGTVLLTINVHFIRIIKVNAAHALRNE